MRVKKLSLKNFKSFPTANVQFDGGFAAVVGPNGSGKSSRGIRKYFFRPENSNELMN